VCGTLPGVTVSERKTYRRFHVRHQHDHYWRYGHRGRLSRRWGCHFCTHLGHPEGQKGAQRRKLVAPSAGGIPAHFQFMSKELAFFLGVVAGHSLTVLLYLWKL
jgi:hypothetical protein